ncbi:SPW repeat protein [Noviherbaspirillum pedocola]|uniref:SPW repeat protein n=1 Tax=Noviherbaspirillum pedocola TaxID=2801341 RepID=A0A934T1L4_9BURK|nr:SPW repeat protein [Noviherbaspirillum pedocola]MBK4739146.1 SPW repeat protein [Noviherbaspirillum pedocola]
MKSKRWQDSVNLVLAVWLFLSPWLLGYGSELPKAARNAWLLGAAVTIVAVATMYAPRVWEEIVNFVLGAWGVVSPWILGFSDSRVTMLNMVVASIIIAALALWAVMRDHDFGHRLHRGGSAS